MSAMRLAAAVATLIVVLAPPSRGDAPTPSFPESPAANPSVAASDDASALHINPAAIGVRYRSEIFSSWTDLPGDDTRFRILATTRGLGLGWEDAPDGEGSYRFGLAGGEERLRVGTRVAWSYDGAGTMPGDVNVGALARPTPWASLGVTVDHLFRPQLRDGRPERDWTLGLGLRPLALVRRRAFEQGPRFTLTADVLLREHADNSQARLRFGAEIEVTDGVAVRGAIEDHGGARLGIALFAPRSSAHGHTVLQDNRRQFLEYVGTVHEGEDASKVPVRRRLLELKVGGRLADESLAGVSLLGGGEATRASGPLHRALEAARRDPLTRGVLLELRGVSGMAQLEELRERIAALRAGGKPVVAWLPYGGGRGDLYLASACDRVVSAEDADFSALGLRVERRYWRRLLADLGVRFDRASHGRFKSAYREFSVDSTPAADREAIEHSLDVVQEQFVAAVAGDRGLERADVLRILDGRMWPPEEVAKAGLVDALADRDSARAELGALAGLGKRPTMARPGDLVRAKRAWTVPTRVAVVYASGAIEIGRSANDLLFGPTLGSETLIEQVEQALERDDVEAVVLRIESPGGSSLASAQMDRAVERLKRETKKPLIVSMGGVAASGGYHLAVHGDRLYADRFTWTGSIGVVFVKPSIEGFLREHRVRQDAFERGRYMRGWSGGEDWDAELQAAADSSVRDTYRRFVTRVAHGRGLTYQQVDAVAQGRSWLGEDAVARGLVDEIGGLEASIAEARRRGGIPEGEEIRIAEYRRPQPGLVSRLIGSYVRQVWERSVGMPRPGALYDWADDAVE